MLNPSSKQKDKKKKISHEKEKKIETILPPSNETSLSPSPMNYNLDLSIFKLKPLIFISLCLSILIFSETFEIFEKYLYLLPIRYHTMK